MDSIAKGELADETLYDVFSNKRKADETAQRESTKESKVAKQEKVTSTFALFTCSPNSSLKLTCIWTVI
jgi:hypothetical protein